MQLQIEKQRTVFLPNAPDSRRAVGDKKLQPQLDAVDRIPRGAHLGERGSDIGRVESEKNPGRHGALL